MGHRIAEQLPEEYVSMEDVESYRVPELEDSEELTGVMFKLPYTPSRFDSQPVLCVYGSEELTGYFFKGTNLQQDTVFGLEGPSESEALESGEYPVSEIAPFLGRHDNLKDGFRHYTVPVNNRYSHEVVADIKSGEQRELENLMLNSFEKDNLISQILIGRNEEGWDFLSTKPQEIQEETK